MKRFLITAILAVSVIAATSCVRDEDWELLRHPVHVRGTLDPNFGTPIAYGHVTINDVLHMFNGDYTGLLDPEDDILTINFEAEGSDSILARSLMSKSVGTKGFFMASDTTISYNVNITLFDNVTLHDIVNNNISINHLWLDFVADIRGDCPESVRDTVARYVHAVFDSLVVKYTDYNGVVHNFPGVDIEPIPFDSVLATKHIQFDSIDMAEIVNSMPRNVNVSFRFRFALDDTIFALDLADAYFSQLLDSIKMTKIYYDANVKVAFPFEIKINSLPYSFDVDLGEGLSQVDIDAVLDSIGEGVDVDIKDSYLTLGFANGIPLELGIAGTLIDANGLPLGTPLFVDTIIAAPSAPSPDDPTTNIAIADTTTRVVIAMNRQRLQQLRNAKKIRFDMQMATGNKHVSIRRSDYLKIKVYLKLHPEAVIDIPIYNGNND
jgi:hypothetical protein